jgi:uncharacterized membrane protein
VEKDVIEQLATGDAGSWVQLRLRPRRALTARQLCWVFVALATATWAVALLTYLQGNVFAPAFAFLDCAFVAASLRWAWLRGERFETIALGRAEVVVRRSSRPEPLLQAHPYWVRLRVSDASGDPQVVLGSAGREVQVGAFLSEAERRDLVDRLRQFLASAAAPLPSTDHSSRVLR